MGVYRGMEEIQGGSAMTPVDCMVLLAIIIVGISILIVVIDE